VAKSSTLYYPIWLAYATGVLEKEGYQVELIDAPAMGWGKKEVCNFARKFKPEFSVVDTTTPSIYSDEKIADDLKRITGGLTFLVGTHASALPEQTLKETKYVDGIAVGEYDYTLLDLANSLRTKVNWQGVQGIAFRENGRVRRTQNREKIDKLDDIPFVSKVYKKHLFPYINKYFYGANRHPVITIVSGRGCPYKCVYCVYPQVMLGHRYRYRSIKDVVDELEYIKKEFPQVKEVFLEDDTLTINKERVMDLCREIKKRKLRIVWSANSRAQVDYDTLREMKRSGCRLLCVGYESADQNVLDSIGKGLKVKEIYQFAKDSKRAGILIHGCFLVGNPGETKETLNTTLEMAKAINPDTAQFYPVMAYPGTRLYKWAEENNYLITQNFREWATPCGLHNCVISKPGLSNKDLVSWANEARREFYLRPSYFIAKVIQVFRHPSELGRLFRGFKSLSRFIFKKKKG
jgi:radical SAM superfamily enzyme YgiQ (UPF0313 family)